MVILHASYALVVGELEGIEHRPGEFCIPRGNPVVEHMKILLRARLLVYDPCRRRENRSAAMQAAEAAAIPGCA